MNYDNFDKTGSEPSFGGLAEMSFGNGLDAAREYQRRGFNVTPLRGKKPLLQGWQDRELTADELSSHFADGNNVGVVLGSPAGLVDIDLDNPLAVTAAEALLPGTVKSGRVKNPKSHWWYLCTLAPVSKTYSISKPMAERLDSVNDVTLVELRSTGRQTVLPPSIHPEDGDRYFWYPGEILEISGEELGEHVQNVAIATLLALYWAPGCRQKLALSTAGYLGRHMAHGRVEDIVEATAKAASDEEAAKRVQAAHGTLQKLKRGRDAVTGGPILEEVAPGVPTTIANWCGWRDTEGSTGDEGESRTSPSQTDALLGYVNDVELFHAPDGTAHATMCKDGHKEHWPVRGREFGLYLRSRFFEDRHRAPSPQSINDAIETAGAQALFKGSEEKVHLRVAGHGDAVYLDLCNDNWEVIEITAEGWRVVADPPVRFGRRANSAALPRPEQGGSVDDLHYFLNVQSYEHFQLIVGWLVGALNPDGPYPILEINGQQGSAKSTTMRVLRSLIDPAKEPLRSLPMSEHDLAIAARGNWVLAFDNLSYIRPQISDALCRISNGGGFGTRRLYTDDEETLFSAKRPQIINGINQVALRGDLQERSILVSLPAIPASKRQSEKEFWHGFTHCHSGILGALLDAVSGALRRSDRIKLHQPPRMADFAIWVTAAESSLGWATGEFMRAYSSNREKASEATLEADPVAAAVVNLVNREEGEWSGTTQELQTELDHLVDDAVSKSKTWPKAPNALSRHMNRIAPVLNEASIEYGGHEEGHTRRKVKVLQRIHHDHGTKNVAPTVEILPENRPDEGDDADIVFGSDGVEDAEEQ